MAGQRVRRRIAPLCDKRSCLDLRTFCQRAKPAAPPNMPSPPILSASSLLEPASPLRPASMSPTPFPFTLDVIGGNFDFGGRNFNAGDKADIFLDSTNILLVPQGKLLDGYFGASVTVPAGYVKYDASATGARGTITSETSGGGWGDMNMQFQLGWDGESFSHTIYLLGVIPTGRYKTGFSPIIGLNRPSLDLAWAFTYFDKNSKLQINGSVGFMASMENVATQYQTGNEFHAEWAIGYKFDNGLLLGVVGYDYRQVTGNSGPGALLGSFREPGDAVGPGLSYSTLIGECRWSSTFAITNNTIGKTFFTGTRRLPRLPRSSRPLSRWSLLRA